MPVTVTTLDSFLASVSNSGHSESTFGKELPRRSEYEGLGFDQDQMGEGGSVTKKVSDEGSSRTDGSGYGNALTTPATRTSGKTGEVRLNPTLPSIF